MRCGLLRGQKALSWWLQLGMLEALAGMLPAGDLGTTMKWGWACRLALPWF